MTEHKANAITALLNQLPSQLPSSLEDVQSRLATVFYIVWDKTMLQILGYLGELGLVRAEIKAHL